MHIPLEGTGPIDLDLRRRAATALQSVLPRGAVLFETEDTRPYECDGLALYRQSPMVVVLPETEEQVAETLRICSSLALPVVPRGAGTGLSGGAMPHSAGVLLSLAKLNAILEIDPRARTARVQPGARNLAISEAAATHGLFYAPDPSSQIACTIGGNVAENSGGVHCLKYGLTGNNVLAVRGLTMEGEAVTVGSAALDSPGLDLLSVVLGSEGMLLVVTEVLVRLMPKPACARCIMASFGDVETAGEAVAAVIAAGIIPAGLEMMDQAATRMVEPFVRAGYDLDAAAILLCEADGTAEEVAEDIARVSEILRAAGATRISVSSSEAERLRFWAGRKNAFPAAGRVSPDYYCMDGTIPRRQLGPVLHAIRQMEQKYALACPNVFHAGDGNLHPLILFDANDPGSVERAEAFGAEILELCIAVGGTVTGEHGVGIEKINQLCLQFDAPTREAFFAVRRAFDPQGLLNQGKVIPTLHRCAEFGRLHVHQGRIPHPTLPRF
ncbi:MAG TPA: FAD-linked oxidase C-terminal domain-containing protein [Steroidobacteraceae bacterium]|nr:FAD-linked oxidase C-terminal domain-containing protein [Steroidobacteraceae bacterium]